VEKSYGRRFLESLPPARLVHDLQAVADFLGTTRKTSSRPGPSPARER
jgi:hypothetical protein